MAEQSDRKRILIVDDVPENVDVLVGLLSDYQRIVALNGEKALEKARAEPQPDLILLDVMMPGMDGFEVCRQLKSEKKTRSIPVIFVTALGEVTDETKGFELGAVDYLTKPIRPPVVLARVKTHLQLEQARADLRQLYQETFAGTIGVLSDILAVASPFAFSRASRMSRLVKLVADQLGVRMDTKLQIAAMLSQIGCIVLPPRLAHKVATGKTLSLGEQEQHNKHSDIARKLLSRIPRMSEVVGMIELQHPRYRKLAASVDIARDAVHAGGSLLRLAADYDLLVGVEEEDENAECALTALRAESLGHDTKLIDALTRALQLEEQQTTIRQRDIPELSEGMVLAQDVVSGDGSTILVTKGSVLSRAMILRLGHFYGEGLISNAVSVRLPVRKGSE